MAAAGSGPSAATYASEPVAVSSALPACAGSGTSSSTGTPSTVTPSARRSSRSSTATICGSSAKAREHRGGVGGRADDREPLAGVAPAARVAGRLPAERRRDPERQLASGREQDAALRRRLLGRHQRGQDLRLDLRPDPGHGPQPPGRGRLAELLRGADAERPRDLDRALRGQPQVAAEPDQAGRQLALELGELRDLAGLQQLLEPPLDPGADPAQLLHATLAHERVDRRRGAADQLRGAPVRADRVGIGLRELEQRREGVEAVGDRGVLHPSSVPTTIGRVAVPEEHREFARRAEEARLVDPMPTFEAHSEATGVPVEHARALALVRWASAGAEALLSVDLRRSTTSSTRAAARTGRPSRGSSTGSPQGAERTSTAAG